MRKEQEIGDPNSCLNKGPATELKFVIREVDITAPDVVRYWAAKRIERGKNAPGDPQITEALAWADAAESHLAQGARLRDAAGKS